MSKFSNAVGGQVPVAGEGGQFYDKPAEAPSLLEMPADRSQVPVAPAQVALSTWSSEWFSLPENSVTSPRISL